MYSASYRSKVLLYLSTEDNAATAGDLHPSKVSQQFTPYIQLRDFHLSITWSTKRHRLAESTTSIRLKIRWNSGEQLCPETDMYDRDLDGQRERCSIPTPTYVYSVQLYVHSRSFIRTSTETYLRSTS